jgi:hypothetical protein
VLQSNTGEEKEMSWWRIRKGRKQLP